MEALKLIGWIVAWVIAILCTGWAAAALYFDFPSTRFNIVAAGIFIALVLLAIIFARGRVIKLVTVFAAFGLVLVWWRTLQPPRDREWAPEVAQTGWADISGDDVTLHNVRNCDYRSENDFDARWETRTVRLSQLQGMDLLIMYWGSPYMAHPIVSFRFADALPICFSIETRKAVGQGYSALRGLFRQYPLIYIVADERDSVRVRAKYRHGEEVYLYRTLASPAQARARFMEYVSALNKLHDQPRWYNA